MGKTTNASGKPTMVTVMVQKMTSPPCRAVDLVGYIMLSKQQDYDVQSARLGCFSSKTLLFNQQDKAAGVCVHNCQVLVRA